MHAATKMLTGTGARTFVAGDRYTYQLTTLRNIVTFGSLHAYLRRLVLSVTLNIANTSGGQLTVGWRHLYDILVGCKLTLKTADKVLYELQTSAGQALMQEQYLKTRKNPEYQTDLVIANNANATVNLKYFLSFFDLRMREPEDQMIYTPLLDASELEIQWSAANIFGAGMTISLTLTTLAGLAAEVTARNEIRTPTVVRVREQNPVAVGNTELDIQGHFALDIALEPVHAAGQATTTFAAADVTSVKLTVDGVTVVDSLDPAMALIPQFNEDTFSSADRLPQWEGGANVLLPIVYQTRANGKKSKIFYSKGKPLLEMAGAITLTAYRILERLITPIGEDTARSMLAKVGISPGPYQLRPKASLKNVITDGSTVLVTPWKYDPFATAPKKPAAAAA